MFVSCVSMVLALAAVPVLANIQPNGIAFQGTSYQGVRLNGVATQGENLNGMNVQGVRLNGMTPQGVRLNGADGTSETGVSLSGVKAERGRLVR